MQSSWGRRGTKIIKFIGKSIRYSQIIIDIRKEKPDEVIGEYWEEAPIEGMVRKGLLAR